MELLCPYCKKDLNSPDSMNRSVIVNDSDWISIRDGRLINSCLAPTQPEFGKIHCTHCSNDIHEHILDLIDSNILDEGDISGL